MLPVEYKKFLESIADIVAPENIITDPLRTVTFGTDASFYQLVPKIVLNVEVK